MKKIINSQYLVRFLAIFGVLMFAIAGMASTNMSGGDIKGVVFDKEAKEPLVGAKVSIHGTGLGAITDIDGVFVLKNVPEGPITLVVSYVSFKTEKLEDINVKKGEVKTLEIQLVSDDEVLDEVIVLAKANRASEIQLLKDQRTLVVATQAIGANELSRKGIGDAEAAVAQVSGVSKQEGVKNVFIRGLSDRYNATYLNGFPIPSDDPEYKNIALDMFDTDMIQSVSVQKAFSATQGGDVGGAIIDIKSQELFGDASLEVGVSGGANTSVLGNTFYKQDGTSYFGGTRSKMPETIVPGVYPFESKIQPLILKSPINHGFNIAAGKKVTFGGGRFPLALYLVANHSKGYSHSERISRTLNPIGTLNSELKGPNSSITTRQMVLGNATLGIDYEHELRYNILMIHSNNEFSAQLGGSDTTYDTDGLVKFYRQQANENLLLVNQLDTDWQLAEGLLFNVGASLNKMDAKEPDRRIFELNNDAMLENGDIKWGAASSDANDRFYSNLKEDDYNAKASFNWILADPISVRFGYKGRFVNHEFDAVEFNHTSTFGVTILDSEFDRMDWDEIFYNSSLMSDERGKGFQLTKGTKYWYNSKKNIHTGFLEALWNITPNFMIQAGIRMDNVDLTVNYGEGEQTKNESHIDEMYWLPSLNIKYDINEDHTVRLSGSKSYTLPQVKEISPYQYINIGYVSFGDPNIKPSDVWNIDLKWDWYMSPKELLSLTLFYKDIKNPIARVDQYISSGAQEYTNLTSKVQVAGVEVELRKNLMQVQSGDVYHKLDLGMSGSYIYSDLYLDSDKENARHAALEGASPWIVNTDLTYGINVNEKNYSLALLLSYFSDRIHTYGSAGIVNKGMYNDIMEKGMANLDLVLSADITKKFSLKFKGKNLLDQPYRRTQMHNSVSNGAGDSKPVVISEYSKGMSFSLSAKYTF